MLFLGAFLHSAVYLMSVYLSFIALAVQQRWCDAGLDQVPGGPTGADR